MSRHQQTTPYTFYIIGITIAVFLAQLAFATDSGIDWFTRLFAFTPNLAFSQPWTFITAMFLHGGIVHLFFNMFTLYMFGPLLEYKIGPKKFLALYFATGILGNIGYMLLSPDQSIPGLGASGAIYGLLGALAVLEPNIGVYMFFFTPLPLWMAAIIWAGINFVGTVFDLAGGIGYSAHLAGLFAGAIYGHFERKKGKGILEEYGLENY